MRIHLPHLFSKWRYCGWCGEKSWAWIWHQKSTLKVWTCLLLKFKCKFCREKVTKTRLKYVSCRLVPRIKCGSIKSEVSLWLSSYQLWYQMKVAVISAELRFAKLSPEKWLLVSDMGCLCLHALSYLIIGYLISKRSSDCGDCRFMWSWTVAEVWVTASVWQCVLAVSLSDISGLASSARTALLAPLVCLICSLRAEHLPIWPQAMERLALSVSALLRIVRSPLSNPPTGWPCRLQGN